MDRKWCTFPHCVFHGIVFNEHLPRKLFVTQVQHDSLCAKLGSLWGIYYVMANITQVLQMLKMVTNRHACRITLPLHKMKFNVCFESTINRKGEGWIWGVNLVCWIDLIANFRAMWKAIAHNDEPAWVCSSSLHYRALDRLSAHREAAQLVIFSAFIYSAHFHIVLICLHQVAGCKKLISTTV